MTLVSATRTSPPTSSLLFRRSELFHTCSPAIFGGAPSYYVTHWFTDLHGPEGRKAMGKGESVLLQKKRPTNNHPGDKLDV